MGTSLVFPLQKGMIEEVKPYKDRNENERYLHMIRWEDGIPYGERHQFLVSHSERLGKAGEEVSMQVKVGAFVKRGRYVDEETGEEKRTQRQTVYLRYAGPIDA